MTRANDELPDPERELLGLPPAPTPEEEAEAERLAREKAEDRKLFLYRLMNDPDFRGWLWSKLMEFNAFGHTFAASPTGFPDNQATWFHLGMKAAGWALWEEFDNAVPELASQMRREGTGVQPVVVTAAPTRRKRVRRQVDPEEQL